MIEGFDLSPVIQLYDESLAHYGRSAKGVGWSSEESQTLRFEQLISVIDQPVAEPLVINDLGCGYGALVEFLEDRGLPVNVYYGYDISEGMLRQARERDAAVRCEFLHADRVTHEADYSFASGIFNVKLSVDADEWIAYVQSVIRNLAAHSKRGFSFNLLTTYADYEEPHLFYGDPLWWFDWCKREISPLVSLVHDYPLFEWTMIVRKGGLPRHLPLKDPSSG